jgi:hypothetical protein
MAQFQTLSVRQTTPRTWRRNQNTIRHRIGAGLGPVSHTVLIAVMLCILGLLYLTQITKTSTYGYQINDLKTQKDELLSEKRDLEVENARLQALERVKQSDVAKAMTNPSSTEYVQ